MSFPKHGQYSMTDQQNSLEQETIDRDIAMRKRNFAILARMPTSELKDALATLKRKPIYTFDRKPEFGMVMSEGRSGGTGSRFNLGHISITRAALRLNSGEQGIGYCLGQDEEKAELIAVFDALLKTDQAKYISDNLVEPARYKQQAECDKVSKKSASSTVDFFTMARADNPDKNLRK